MAAHVLRLSRDRLAPAARTALPPANRVLYLLEGALTVDGRALAADSVRRVVETGTLPLINTGIAGRKAGVGQVGAGVVRAPLGCFTAALEALAE